MGDFYKIIKAMGGDDEAQALATIIDSKLIKVDHDITLLGMKTIYTIPKDNTGIDMRHYIERTDAIDKNTAAIRDLTHGLLNIEGCLKRQ